MPLPIKPMFIKAPFSMPTPDPFMGHQMNHNLILTILKVVTQCQRGRVSNPVELD
jgi:hypothetical protein